MAKATLLIVDDHLQDFDLIVDIFSQQDYLVKSASSGWAALALIENALPDLILLDIEMPGMSGYEVCTQLKTNPYTRDIPVIFVSVSDQLFDKVKAFSVGAVDYVSKPYQIEELLARVNTHLTLKKLTKELAKKEQALQQEVKKRQEYEKILEEIIHIDYLTKTFNRRHFTELGQQEIARAHKNNLPIALVLVTIDHFKDIINAYGHNIGNKILVNLANLCQSKIRDEDILCRYDESEFAIILPNTSKEAAKKMGARLHQVVYQSFMVTGRTNILITVSIGISFWHGGIELEMDLESLLDQAKQSLILAQEKGGNRLEIIEHPHQIKE